MHMPDLYTLYMLYTLFICFGCFDTGKQSGYWSNKIVLPLIFLYAVFYKSHGRSAINILDLSFPYFGAFF